MLTAYIVWGSQIHHHAKFHRNGQVVAEIS